MVRRPKIKAESESVGMKALCFLHRRYANSENIVFTEKELHRKLVGVSLSIIHYVLEYLIINKLIDHAFINVGGDTVYGYSISPMGINIMGINIVEAWADEHYEELAKGIDFLDDESDENDSPRNFESKKSKSSIIPAADRVVTLDHNGEDYKNTIEALSAVVKEAEKSNEFGALFANPEDRVRTLAEMRNGISLLENLRVKVGAIQDLLISNLELIKEKLPDVALNTFASKALELLIKLLSSS